MLFESLAGMMTLPAKATAPVVAKRAFAKKWALMTKGLLAVNAGHAFIPFGAKSILITHPGMTATTIPLGGKMALATGGGMGAAPVAAKAALGAAKGATAATSASSGTVSTTNALSGNAANCLSSVVETVKNQGLSLASGSVAGGAVGQQVSKRRHNKEKEGLQQELAQALEQVAEIDSLQKQLLAAEAKTSELQAELSTLSAETSSTLIETAKAAVEAAKLAAERATLPVEEALPDVEEALPPVEAAQPPYDSALPPVEAQQLPYDSAQAPVPDDLKRIKGIGRVFEARLNQAGISTFADLAELTPEQIREIVSEGKVENMIEPEEWIAQARQLAIE